MNRIACWLGVWSLCGGLVLADDIRIATWNVHEGFTSDAMKSRSETLSTLYRDVRPDVLLVQEVTSLAVVEALRDALGLEGYHCTCSDFFPSDAPDFTALEVGIISRFPLSQVIEYDATPDRTPDRVNSPPEVALNPVLKLGIERPSDDIRGFLSARIDALRLIVYVVHLKSSRGVDGPQDFANAAKREFVAAAIATSVLEDRLLFPEFTCLVGGDFNVGHDDRAKNGVLLGDDDPARDGYDETHALLRAGIVGGLKMTNLLAHTRMPTFPAFPSTPIDNLYVVGPAEARFSPAVISESTYGSDHRPVTTRLTTEIFPELPPRRSATIPPPGEELPPITDVLGVEAARRHVGRVVTVEFAVRSATVLSNGSLAFLNSAVDFRQPENFTIVLTKEMIEKLGTGGIADPARHFQGKTIRATGRVEQRRGQSQITLADPEHLVIVAPRN